jgi:hypothetical protein
MRALSIRQPYAELAKKSERTDDAIQVRKRGRDSDGKRWDEVTHIVSFITEASVGVRNGSGKSGKGSGTGDMIQITEKKGHDSNASFR